jgi:hypothetical protein
MAGEKAALFGDDLMTNEPQAVIHDSWTLSVRPEEFSSKQIKKC